MDDLKFLQEKHKKILDVMQNVTDGRVLPLIGKIEFQDMDNLGLFVGYNSRCGVDLNAYIRIKRGRSFVEQEYTLAHETGHYADAVIGKTALPTIHKKFFRYREVCAEFFALTYFDKTESINHFINGRGKPIYDDMLKNDIYCDTLKLYLTMTSMEKREQLCKALFEQNYENLPELMEKGISKRMIKKLETIVKIPK